jgi:adenylate kinase
MINIILYGSPGCGKGTQAKLLCERLNLYHINTGDLLRKEKSTGSELGQLISSYIDNGNLVPDEVSTQAVEKEYNKTYSGNVGGYVFDGFPRSGVQVRNFYEILKSKGEDTTLFVEFVTPLDVIFDRLRTRADVEGRLDDQSDDKIQKRIDHYNVNKNDIIYSYKQSTPYVKIDSTMSIEHITDLILTALQDE